MLLGCFICLHDLRVWEGRSTQHCKKCVWQSQWSISDLGQFIPAICKKWDGSSLALPHLKTLESRGPATQCGKPCIQTHCALCDATAQQARATRPHSGNHQAILVSNVARCYFHSFSGQIHGIFPSPDFSRCMYVYLYIYLSLSGICLQHNSSLVCFAIVC